MIALELEIKNLLESLAPTSGVAKQLSKTKKILDSSSHMVEAVDNFSKALKKNVGKGLGGGITGGVSGWVASKTTKVVGGLGAGAVSAILQTDQSGRRFGGRSCICHSANNGSHDP